MTDIQQIRDTIELTHKSTKIGRASCRERV